MYIHEKFPKELRTFETRLLFIKSLFEDLYTGQEIMTSCISHKLTRSLESLEILLENSSLLLRHADPIKVIKTNQKMVDKF